MKQFIMLYFIYMNKDYYLNFFIKLNYESIDFIIVIIIIKTKYIFITNLF